MRCEDSGATSSNSRQFNEAASLLAREGLDDVSHDLGRSLARTAFLPHEGLEPLECDASVEHPLRACHLGGCHGLIKASHSLHCHRLGRNARWLVRDQELSPSVGGSVIAMEGLSTVPRLDIHRAALAGST